MKVSQAINQIVDHGWPCVCEDGLVHQLYGFDRGAGVWRYRCSKVLYTNAHTTDVCDDPLTCLGCIGTDVFPRPYA